MRVKFTFMCFVIIIIAACNESGDSTVEYFQNEVFKKDIDNSIVLIIPTMGCQGCIDASVKFVKSELKNDKFNVVLTSRNVKELMYFHRNYFDGESNIKTIDQANLEIVGLESSWPLVLFLENKVVGQIYKLNAKNIVGELARISDYLKKEIE